MGLWVFVIALILLSSPTSAAPIQFSFTGNTGTWAMNLGAGDIDLVGVDFSVTGITREKQCFLEPAGFCHEGMPWLATVTYDFGAFGSFSTDRDVYQQYFDTSGNLIGAGLRNNYPGITEFQGFLAFFAPIAATTSTELIAFGTPTVTANTAGSWLRTILNDEGQSLRIWDSRTHLHITSASAVFADPHDVPEPATLTLLTLGLGLTAVRRRFGQGNPAR